MKHKKNKQQNKDWLDWWLSDEEPPPEVESSLKTAYIPPPEAELPRQELPPEPAATNVVVNLHVPKIKLPEIKKTDVDKLKKLRHHSFAQASAFAVGMMLAGLASHSFIFKSPPQPAGDGGTQQVLSASLGGTSPAVSTLLTPAASSSSLIGVSGATSTANTNSTKASFTPVAPASKPDLGNYAFAKTSYDSSTDTYRYEDTIGGSPLTVSEQPLPTGSTSAQAAVEKVATTLGANQQIIAGGGTVYMYSDPKTYAQTLIFSLQDLLISINSNYPHTTTDWQGYINSL